MNCKWHLTLHRECSQFVLQTLKAVNKKHARQKAITYTRLIKSDLVKPRRRNLWKGWKDQLGPFSTYCRVGDNLWITISFGETGFCRKSFRLGYFHHKTLILWRNTVKLLGSSLIVCKCFPHENVIKFLKFTKVQISGFNRSKVVIWFDLIHWLPFGGGGQRWVGESFNLDKVEKFTRKSDIKVTYLRSPNEVNS